VVKVSRRLRGIYRHHVANFWLHAYFFLGLLIDIETSVETGLNGCIQEYRALYRHRYEKQYTFGIYIPGGKFGHAYAGIFLS
jgi:hypothetical protein